MAVRGSWVNDCSGWGLVDSSFCKTWTRCNPWRFWFLWRFILNRKGFSVFCTSSFIRPKPYWFRKSTGLDKTNGTAKEISYSGGIRETDGSYTFQFNDCWTDRFEGRGYFRWCARVSQPYYPWDSFTPYRKVRCQVEYSSSWRMRGCAKQWIGMGPGKPELFLGSDDKPKQPLSDWWCLRNLWDWCALRICSQRCIKKALPENPTGLVLKKVNFLGLELRKVSSFHGFLEILFRVLFPATLSTGWPEVNCLTVVLDWLGLGVDNAVWVNWAETLLE